MIIRLNGGTKMKIRQGFVSNSSSSSFCIYGTYVHEEDILTYKELAEKGIMKDDPKYYNYSLDSIIEMLPFYTSNMSGNRSGWYIGEEMSSMDKKETRENFEKRVEEKVKKILKNPESLKFSVLEEAWYNG